MKEPSITMAGYAAVVTTPPADTSDEGVEALLRHDPLDNLEKYTDNPGFGDSLLAVQVAGRRKDDVLKARGDTVLMNDLDRYISIIEGAGFTRELELSFVGKAHNDKPALQERFFIYAKVDEGLILCFDTYGGDHMNGGHIYYNWQPKEGANTWAYTSSGGYHDYDGERTWVGDHDAREALLFNMDQLRRNGKFLPKWNARPFLWLLHHMDTETGDYDYKAINAERIAMMRPEIQEIMDASDN